MPVGSNPVQSIRCCLAKGSRLWVGYWNKVHVVDVDSRKVEVKHKTNQKHKVRHVQTCFAKQAAAIFTSPPSQQTFSVSERSEKQVRFLCAGGSGVWASCRLDPMLRLFDWFTGRPLQEVDFSVLVTKTLGTTNVLVFFSPVFLILFSFIQVKILVIDLEEFSPMIDGENANFNCAVSSSLGQAFLTLAPLQISSLAVASGRLWVGTGGGALFSIPLSISKSSPLLADQVLIKPNPDLYKQHHCPFTASEAASIPYCSTASAQLCYHGHRQAVRFIIAAPGEILTLSCSLVEANKY